MKMMDADMQLNMLWSHAHSNSAMQVCMGTSTLSGWTQAKNVRKMNPFHHCAQLAVRVTLQNPLHKRAHFAMVCALKDHFAQLELSSRSCAHLEHTPQGGQLRKQTACLVT